MPSSADTVQTLADLARWPHTGPALAVLGHPIAHSLSPPMHNAALAALAREDPRYLDWRYFRFDVPPADLPRALDLLHEKKFCGLNLTVPHKILAFDLVADTDAAARPIGAVNTLVWNEHGWHGHNTDGYGLAAAVRESLGRELAGAHIVLLGAGGAARAAAVECLRQSCASLWIGNRTRANLDIILAVLAPLAGNTPLHAFTLDAPPPNFPAGAIMIQATVLGLHPGDSRPFDLRQLPHPAGVYDMTYTAASATALVAQARDLGLPSADGLAMLVHQGAKSLEVWTGAPAAQTAPIMRAAAEAARAGAKAEKLKG
ncbi:MAG: shikimate dehydrogenase [Opitutaceae bacterium]|jgi:shikimate dehydrogenase